MRTTVYHLTDENGNQLVDENGNELVAGVLTTDYSISANDSKFLLHGERPFTEYSSGHQTFYLVDENGNQLVDENGNELIASADIKCVHFTQNQQD